MSRVIKFRAYSEKIGMKSVDQITFTDKTWSCENGFGVSIPFQPNIILMQFTGLLDKKGKEIYEGDIIKYAQHEGYLLPSFVAPILWVDEYACFGYKTIADIGERDVPFSEHDELQHDFLNYCEVIGDIYSNPNLLERGE